MKELEARMTKTKFLPFVNYREYPVEEMQQRAAAFYADIQRRRTVRHFSDRSVPREIIENCLRTAATAPSGANMQPWHFVVVTDPKVKRQIREAAEKEEREFYSRRASQEWLEALEPLGTSEHKPFLETASHLIVIFAQRYGMLPDGSKVKHYYVKESVGIATGILVVAIHHAGLVSLTYTPSSMRFLNGVLGRPANERAFLILVVGYPADNAVVPDISKKSLAEIATFV
jgi:iodotyrosine deiodinase